MLEVTGNLWSYQLSDGTRPSAIVITTNGTVKKNGEAVMGRGCAAEARKRFPPIARWLGSQLLGSGNHLACYDTGEEPIVTFPVKHHWHEKADLVLIERSARELKGWTDLMSCLVIVVMPRPGCGNGLLWWCYCDLRRAGTNHTQGSEGLCGGVKHILEPILDDRFHVISLKGN